MVDAALCRVGALYLLTFSLDWSARGEIDGAGFGGFSSLRRPVRALALKFDVLPSLFGYRYFNISCAPCLPRDINFVCLRIIIISVSRTSFTIGAEG